MNFKFKKGDTLIPKIDRTFDRIVYPRLTVEAFKDKNYVLKTNNKLVKFSFLFIEKNYEIEDKDKRQEEINEEEKKQKDESDKIRQDARKLKDARRRTMGTS